MEGGLGGVAGMLPRVCLLCKNADVTAVPGGGPGRRAQLAEGGGGVAVGLAPAAEDVDGGIGAPFRPLSLGRWGEG